MHELTYESGGQRLSAAVPVGCGGVLCTVLGVVLWIACLAFSNSTGRWIYLAVFPFDYIISLAVYHASNGSSSVSETAGVIIWLLAPLQFALYGGAIGLGMARGRPKLALVIVLCCHVAAAAVALCMDVAVFRS